MVYNCFLDFPYLFGFAGVQDRASFMRRIPTGVILYNCATATVGSSFTLDYRQLFWPRATIQCINNIQQHTII